MSILQNIHFSYNKKINNSDKADKLGSVIDLLGSTFQAPMSDGDRQSIDEHMIKFKGQISCRQYMKNNPINW